MVVSTGEKGGAIMAEPTSKRRRILYVAHGACGNPALCAEVRANTAAGMEVLVVAPVLSSGSHRWTSDDVEDRERAETRLEESIACLHANGVHVHGTLGDAEPVQAIADALFAFAADEIVVCLEERERSHWAHKGVVERARERFGLPITEIDVAERAPAVLA